MFEFRMAEHQRIQIDTDTKILEVWRNGRLMATIYPTEDGIKLVSTKDILYVPGRPEKSREVTEVDCNEFPTAILINLI